MENNLEILQKLSKLKRLQIIVFITCFGCTPLAFIVFLISGSEDAAKYFFFTCFGLAIATSIVQGLSRCPLCHNKFFYGKYWGNGFAQNCMHCKLPLNANDVDIQKHRSYNNKQYQPWEPEYFDAIEEIEIYVYLENEGTDVWRPVMALPLGNDLYQIITENTNPDDENWQFSRGDIVRCKEKAFANGTNLVAVEGVEAI